MSTVRNPVVAGKFYTSSPKDLEREIKGYLSSKAEKYDVRGCISPHAGYMYSGYVAGCVFSSITPRDAYIVLGPNHTGIGLPFGLDAGRKWLTPLGEVEIDKELSEAVLDISRFIKKDERCHDYEHSIEVQLPFLQILSKNFKFVPIIIGGGGLEEYKEMGKEIAGAIKETGSSAMIIASSDMTHYEPHEVAKKKDKLAINKILELDVDGFFTQVVKHDISMCGYAPTAIMLSACKELGAQNALLIKYQTSGETSGDYSAVVGYAGIVVY